MELDLGKISNRQKLILGAVRKMDQGTKLFTEGKLEFEHLTEEKKDVKGAKTTAGGKDVTDDIQKLVPKKRKQPTVLNKTLRRKKRIKAADSDIQLAERVIGVVKKNGYWTVDAVKRKIKSGFYSLKRAIDVLIEANRIRYVRKAHPNTRVTYNCLALT